MDLAPRVILKSAFTVVGLSRPLARLDGDLEALWQELGDRYDEIPQADPDAGYGVHTRGDFGRTYLAGLALGLRAGDIPADMATIEIDAHAYAVFTHTGLLQDLPATVEDIFEDWLPGSSYAQAADFFFEYYDDRFTPGSPDSVAFLWVPVVPKGLAPAIDGE